MDHGGEALIGLAGAHRDAFELFEPAEEVLNEMPPFVATAASIARPAKTKRFHLRPLGVSQNESVHP
jgi:ATP-dependent protease HslVU (ClpYQ) peptidase subunit